MRAKCHQLGAKCHQCNLVSISTYTGTPKASSTTKNHDPALLPPSPSTNAAVDNKANSEIDELREMLRRSEEQAQQNYDEMKEYQSWLEQAEEGQGVCEW